MTENRANLVITGYMGTGKSSVARRAARHLGRPCVDMDEIIAQRAGKPIPAIFEEDGEAAFRRYERDLCEELSRREGLVISTGGGALVDPRNRETMIDRSCVICLDCDPRELRHRLGGDRGRPMLWAGDPSVRLEQLLEERREAYSVLPYHIDTTYRSVEQVVSETLRIYRDFRRIWRVGTPTGDYDVHLQQGGLSRIGELLAEQGIESQVVLVSDENVWPLHGERVRSGFKPEQLAGDPIVLPAGEQHKTLETVRALYDRFVDYGLDRSGAVVALGGGVITDMAGFAAATFMRGTGLVQVPTTLLGMVDASVGGKVAVDHPRGKNLVGAFVRPLLVMLDPKCLSTLPEEEYRAGMAEVIKHGIIADGALFSALESGTSLSDNSWLIANALPVKIDIIEEDPYEQGRRAILNLGHTFAHAFEVLSDYQLHHGLAVSMGMAAAAYLAEARGLAEPATRERIVEVLTRHGLPCQFTTHDPSQVYEAMSADKKRRAGKLRFVLPRAIGDVIIDGDVERGEVIAALERIRA